MSGPFLYYSEILLRILPEHDYAVRLEALAESLPLEVVATDVQGRVIVWNAALARVAGPREQALGRPLLEAAPWLVGDRNASWETLLEGALAGEAARTLPASPAGTARRQGHHRAHAGTGPVREVLGAVLCFEDITQLAREEEQRRLRARSEAVTALGAGIAHEIRNPLNALSLNLQLLRERLEDPAATRADLKTKTDAMIAEVARMETLIQNLLAVSRGGAPVTADEYLDPIVAEVASRLAEGALARRVELTFRGGSTRVLPLERMRIERAIENLAQNAIEAAGEPGGTAGAERAGGGHVWITTRDDPHSSVV